MARLLKKSGTGEPEVLELNMGLNRFGRDPENHFAINHPSVSAHHCDITLTAKAVLLRDCNSTNGTFINDKRTKKAMLQAGQTVRLGEVELFVETIEVTIAIPHFDRPRPAQPPPLVALPGDKLHCVRHPDSLVTHQCSNCRQVLCKECVRQIRYTGGKLRSFCSLCSFPVHVLGEPKPPVSLPDGNMLCPRHEEALATYQCTNCSEVMCDSCVHRFRPNRGKVRLSCPVCRHPVKVIPSAKPKKKSLAAYFKQTVKVPFVTGDQSD
ncbi:MAG: FHA domain-containing protein [Verrucomicrobiota bacterium]